jgi:hypothetical protein
MKTIDSLMQERDACEEQAVQLEAEREIFRAFVRDFDGFMRRDDGGLWLPIEQSSALSTAREAITPEMMGEGR